MVFDGCGVQPDSSQRSRLGPFCMLTFFVCSLQVCSAKLDLQRATEWLMQCVPLGLGSEIVNLGSASLRKCRKIDTILKGRETFLSNRLTGAVSPRSTYRQRDLKLHRRELLETGVDAVVWAHLAATLLDYKGSLGRTSGTANHSPTSTIFPATSAIKRQLCRQE